MPVTLQPGAVLAYDEAHALEHDGRHAGKHMISLIDRATGSAFTLFMPSIASERDSVTRYGAARVLATWRRVAAARPADARPAYRPNAWQPHPDLLLPGADARALT